MRVSRGSKKILLAVVALAVVFYGLDDLYARVHGNRLANVQVFHMYKMKNRWNETEYSVGGQENQKCIYSIFPHFGYSPCWYLNRHPMQYINVG